MESLETFAVCFTLACNLQCYYLGKQCFSLLLSPHVGKMNCMKCLHTCDPQLILPGLLSLQYRVLLL